jgi:hypothetical protein
MVATLSATILIAADDCSPTTENGCLMLCEKIEECNVEYDDDDADCVQSCRDDFPNTPRCSKALYELTACWARLTCSELATDNIDSCGDFPSDCFDL